MSLIKTCRARSEHHSRRWRCEGDDTYASLVIREFHPSAFQVSVEEGTQDRRENGALGNPDLLSVIVLPNLTALVSMVGGIDITIEPNLDHVLRDMLF